MATKKNSRTNQKIVSRRIIQGALWAVLMLFGFAVPRLLDSPSVVGAVLSNRVISEPPASKLPARGLPEIPNKNASSVALGTPEISPDTTIIKGDDNFFIPIVMYHYIRYRNPDDAGDVGLSVSPENFRAQLADLKKKGYQTVTFHNVLEHRLPAKPVILTFDDGYQNFYDAAYPELIKHNLTATVYVIANFNKPEYLSHQEIIELSAAGIEIGSHTLDHRMLPILELKEQKRQIIDSKKELEQLVKKPIVSIAYPFGDYSLVSAQTAKAIGYRYAVTTANVLADFSTPFTLGRFRAHDRPDLEFLD